MHTVRSVVSLGYLYYYILKLITNNFPYNSLLAWVLIVATVNWTQLL